MIKKISTISVIICLIACGCGTLGGFDNGTFPVTKRKLEIAIDSLYALHPEYEISTQWEKYNDWSARGYDFLESRIFYFKSPPEEMYYVTFVGDTAKISKTTDARIAIRSVFKGNTKRWVLEKEVDSKERERIEKRFDDEIISKLEQYTQTKAERQP